MKLQKIATVARPFPPSILEKALNRDWQYYTFLQNPRIITWKLPWKIKIVLLPVKVHSISCNKFSIFSVI